MTYNIQSRSNPRVKELIKNKENFFFFEGEKLVYNILERKTNVKILIVHESREADLEAFPKTKISETWIVSETVLEKLSSLKERPDFIAVLELEETPIDFVNSEIVIALDNIQDPGNAGSVARCAAAFGIKSIALTGDSVGLNNSKFIRAAQDSFLNTRFQSFKDAVTLIETAKKANPRIHIYMTSSHSPGNTVEPQHIEFPCLIFLGNEGKGLDENLLEQYPCVSILQTQAVESLNVGVSACIIMYELFKKDN